MSSNPAHHGSPGFRKQHTRGAQLTLHGSNCCYYQPNHPFNPMWMLKGLFVTQVPAPCFFHHEPTFLFFLSLINTLWDCSSLPTHVPLCLLYGYCLLPLGKGPSRLPSFLSLIVGPSLITKVFIPLLLSSNFPSSNPELTLCFMGKYHAVVTH